MTTKAIKKRLEYLRDQIIDEHISYSEIVELQSLAKHIDSGDVVLLEWAGVLEHERNCPRCIDDYTDENDKPHKGIKVASTCVECGVCKDCEHLLGCSKD